MKRMFEIKNITAPKDGIRRMVHLMRAEQIIHSLAPGMTLAVPDMGDWHLSCKEGGAIVLIDERGGDEDDPWMQRLKRGEIQPLTRKRAYKNAQEDKGL